MRQVRGAAHSVVVVIAVVDDEIVMLRTIGPGIGRCPALLYVQFHPYLPALAASAVVAVLPNSFIGY